MSSGGCNFDFDRLVGELTETTACAHQAASLLGWLETQENPFRLKKCLTEAYEVLEEAKHKLARIRRELDAASS